PAPPLTHSPPSTRDELKRKYALAFADVQHYPRRRYGDKKDTAPLIKRRGERSADEADFEDDGDDDETPRLKKRIRLSADEAARGRRRSDDPPRKKKPSPMIQIETAGLKERESEEGDEADAMDI